jgi:hypothetical protein
VATAYWWTLWGLAAASVLAWRLGAPLALTLRHRPVVRAVAPEGPGAVVLHVGVRDVERLRVAAGQFFV